ncbi:hypothetical protein MPER_00340, partial [Moniliophthora perniciosa FA553]
AKFGEVGAGVGLGGYDQVEPAMQIFNFVSGAAPHELVFDYEASMRNPDQQMGVGIYSRTVLHFSDETTHEADVVIGADGIRSVARNFVIEKDSPP